MRSYKHRNHDIVVHLADDHNVMLGDEYTEIDPENDGVGEADESTSSSSSSSSSRTASPAPAPRRGRGRPRKTAK
nr:MAG TPA: AT hook containing protein [Caudoviricetes sp.]